MAAALEAVLDERGLDERVLDERALDSIADCVFTHSPHLAKNKVTSNIVVFFFSIQEIRGILRVRPNERNFVSRRISVAAILLHSVS